MALAIPDLERASSDFESRARACRVTLHEGRLFGRIVDVPRGGFGFGYDPIFLVPEIGRTLAELTLEEKNRTSHRSRALAAARASLVALARA
jgi:non-canonical purine NTP pyrophosphatase (RdgB/HAM1 family)